MPTIRITGKRKLPRAQMGGECPAGYAKDPSTNECVPNTNYVSFSSFNNSADPGMMTDELQGLLNAEKQEDTNYNNWKSDPRSDNLAPINATPFNAGNKYSMFKGPATSAATSEKKKNNFSFTLDNALDVTAPIVNYFDNRKKQKNFDSAARNASFNQLAAPGGFRGNFDQNGIFRPNNYTTNEGQYTNQFYAETGMEIPYVEEAFTPYTAAPEPQFFENKTPQPQTEQVVSSPYSDPSKNSLIYLSHQQGVGGLNAILKAARNGKSSAGMVGGENIDSNMKNNINAAQFYKSFSEITPANFLKYWDNMFVRKEKSNATKQTAYDPFFKEAEKETGLASSFLKTVADIESNFKADANQGAKTRYKGLMQLDVNTYGQDVYDPFKSILYAAKSISSNISRIKFDDYTNNNNMKIRITATPEKQMAYGGQSGYGLDLGNATQETNISIAASDSENSSNTLKAVPREQANLEAEKGETAWGDIDNDGMKEHMTIGGKRHVNGGTPLNLPEGTFIFSDTKKMKIKDPEVLKYFGMSASKEGVTPAEIAKRYDLNRYKSILQDPAKDKVSKRTAEKMIENYNRKLMQLSMVQESMKGFPQGVPKAASETMNGYDEQQQMQSYAPEAAYGGTLPRYQTAGENWFKPWTKSNTIAGGRSKKTGASTVYDDSVDNQYKNRERWEAIAGRPFHSLEDMNGFVYAQSDPAYINQMWEKYGPSNVSDEEDITNFATSPYMGGRSTFLLDGAPNKTRTKWMPDPIPSSGGLKITPPNSIRELPKQMPVPDFESSGSTVPYGWTTPDKLNLANGLVDMASIKKYLPYYSDINVELPNATFDDWRAKAAARQSMYGQSANTLANYQGAQGLGANFSFMAGQTAEGVAGDIDGTNKNNVSIANAVSANRAQLLNQANQYNAANKDKRWQGNVIANQNYDNAMREARKGIVKAYDNGWNNAGNMYNMNVSESPYFYIDPRSNKVNFYSENAKKDFYSNKYGKNGLDREAEMAQLRKSLYNKHYESLDYLSDPKQKSTEALKLANEDVKMMQESYRNRTDGSGSLVNSTVSGTRYGTKGSR